MASKGFRPRSLRNTHEQSLVAVSSEGVEDFS